MESLDALYSVQSALLAAQDTQTTTQTTESEGVSFSDLLGMLSGSGSTSAQQYLFSGLLDGSIEVSDSQSLVSALVGTLDGEEGGLSSLFGSGGDSSGLYSLVESGLISQNNMTALLDLNQSLEDSWLNQLLETLAAGQNTGQESDSEDDAMQQYYQALAAMTQAQKNMLT